MVSQLLKNISDPKVYLANVIRSNVCMRVCVISAVLFNLFNVVTFIV